MKAYIGPYVNWIGPYQIAKWLMHIGVSEDRCHEIGKWLSETWVGPFLQWIHDKKKRKIKIRVDSYDTWSADTTIATLILPILQRYRKHLNSAPFTDDADVPEHIRSSADPDWSQADFERDGSTDKFFHQRWEYIVDEMIWAFEQLHFDSDWEDQYHRNGFDVDGYNKHNERISKGLVLFGKYLRGIWS